MSTDQWSESRSGKVRIRLLGNDGLWTVYAVPKGTGVVESHETFTDEAEARAYANKLWGDGPRPLPERPAKAAPDPLAHAAAIIEAEHRRIAYGVQETNPLEGEHDWTEFEEGEVSLAELQAAGGRVIRLRLLTEPGFAYLDISYVFGQLPNGRKVHVRVQRQHLIKAKGSVPSRGDIVTWAKEEGVFAKGLGLLDEATWSIVS